MRANSRWAAAVTPVAILLLGTMPAFAQTGAKNGEWRTYGGDLGSTRYAPARPDQRRTISTSSKSPGDSRPIRLGSAPGIQARGDAPDGQRRPLHHRRIAAGRGRARRSHRRTALDAQRKRRRARQLRRPASFPATGLPTGPTASEERILYVTPGYRLIALERQDRHARSRLRAKTASSI